MFPIVKNIKSNGLVISFLFSVFIHSGVFLLAGYLLSRQLNRMVVNSIYVEFLNKESNTLSKTKIVDFKKSEIKSHEKIKSEQRKSEAYFYNFNKADYDTSALMQVYKESTLNVSLRYPIGWTYLDQQVKEKLDGVTFWAVDRKYQIPPYIHLDVRDKSIFSPSRFKYKFSNNGRDYYYNDPEALEDYFTQIIYIRTDSDEDYSLKLMVKGKEAFKSFQPAFFNVVKSFNFGKSFF